MELVWLYSKSLNKWMLWREWGWMLSYRTGHLPSKNGRADGGFTTTKSHVPYFPCNWPSDCASTSIYTEGQTCSIHRFDHFIKPICWRCDVCARSGSGSKDMGIVLILQVSNKLTEYLDDERNVLSSITYSLRRVGELTVTVLYWAAVCMRNILPITLIRQSWKNWEASLRQIGVLRVAQWDIIIVSLDGQNRDKLQSER